MAPSPLGISAVLVAASVIKAYCQSGRGKAITGLDTNWFQRLMNASMAVSELFLINRVIVLVMNPVLVILGQSQVVFVKTDGFLMLE